MRRWNGVSEILQQRGGELSDFVIVSTTGHQSRVRRGRAAAASVASSGMAAGT